MDQLRAQLGNYLEWLESRGLTGTVAFHAPTDAPAQTAPGETQGRVERPAEPQQPDAEKKPSPVAPLHASEEFQADARSAAALRSSVAPAPSSAPLNPSRPVLQGSGLLQHEVERPAPQDTLAQREIGRVSTLDANASQFEVGRTPAPASNAPQRECGMPWKVGFYSSSDLTEEEFIMVSKIALALGLPAEDFKIWAEDSLVHVPLDLLRCSYIVALGPGSGQTLLALGQTVAMNTIQKALQGAPLLTIPHPRAMLREAALKGGAWTALQKFKALMVH